jgi:hypothetical protein
MAVVAGDASTRHLTMADQVDACLFCHGRCFLVRRPADEIEKIGSESVLPTGREISARPPLARRSSAGA